MSRKRIGQENHTRCLLTEVAPFESPILFSNWGSYNFCRNLNTPRTPAGVRALFDLDPRYTIPYKFRIKQDSNLKRMLFLVHPKHSNSIVNLYRTYDLLILKACKRSPFSLRSPHRVAKFYRFGKKRSLDEEDFVEDITAESAYASSYFSYTRFSHLHKFFESDDYTELEKRFSSLLRLDISKCFPSLYTHSISWAIYGKSEAKSRLNEAKNKKREKSFDEVFDCLMEDINHRETAGIPVGPELSRIFAEIILQRIDANVLKKLSADDIVYRKDYWCCRYIDDYFLFFDSDAVAARFKLALAEELEKFRLYINQGKISEVSRPFISDISIVKIRIKEFFSQLTLRADILSARNSHHEVNCLRALTRAPAVAFSPVSGFILDCASRSMGTLMGNTEFVNFDAIYVLLELAFHAFRMDIRVSTCFRIASIIEDIKSRISHFAPFNRCKIEDKIVFELKGALDSARGEGASLESINILIIASNFGELEILPSSEVDSLIDDLAKLNNDEYSKNKRLSYFEIVGLLYFVKNKAHLAPQRTRLVATALDVLSEFSPLAYAESAYLFFDLVSCPYLTDPEKDAFILKLNEHRKVAPASGSEVNCVRNFVTANSWYFHWNQKGDLRTHLTKKRFMLAY